MNQETLLLTVKSSANLPMKGQEELRVYANGRSLIHLQAATGIERQAQAGTFATQLAEKRLGDIKQLVLNLLDSKPQPDNRFPEGITSSLAVNDGQDSFSCLLPALQAASSPILERAAVLIHDIKDATFANPLNVVQLSAKTKAMPDQTTTLLLTCTNIGTEPVTFLLRPESFTMWASGPGGRTPIWQNKAGEGSGLINGSGKLIDGVYTAAILSPNSSATAVYPKVISAIQPNMLVDVEGWIELTGPERETAVMPQDPIWLSTAVTT